MRRNAAGMGALPASGLDTGETSTFVLPMFCAGCFSLGTWKYTYFLCVVSYLDGTYIHDSRWCGTRSSQVRMLDFPMRGTLKLRTEFVLQRLPAFLVGDIHERLETAALSLAAPMVLFSCPDARVVVLWCLHVAIDSRSPSFLVLCRSLVDIWPGPGL